MRKIIANNLINAAKCIEDIRSDKTSFHGKSSGSKMIKDPIYAYFIINATATLGLFVVNYQKRHSIPDDSLDYSDLPF